MTDDLAEPRLCWRKTWDDHADDFCVHSPLPGATIGRIMLVIGGPKNGQWQWTYQAAIQGLPWEGLEHSGFRETPREAAAVVEEMWFKAIAGKVYDERRRRFVEAV